MKEWRAHPTLFNRETTNNDTKQCMTISTCRRSDWVHIKEKGRLKEETYGEKEELDFSSHHCLSAMRWHIFVFVLSLGIPKSQQKIEVCSKHEHNRRVLGEWISCPAFVCLCCYRKYLFVLPAAQVPLSIENAKVSPRILLRSIDYSALISNQNLAAEKRSHGHWPLIAEA